MREIIANIVARPQIVDVLELLHFLLDCLTQILQLLYLLLIALS